MTIDELPIEVQNELRESKPKFTNRHINTIREVLVYNKAGTRYFHAWRVYEGVRTMGNPSYWKLRYGKVQFRQCKDPLGGTYYEWCNGKSFGKSLNGTVIPPFVYTKKEVIKVLEQIELFEFR